MSERPPSNRHPFSIRVETDASTSRVLVAGDVDSSQAELLGGLCTALIGSAKRLELDLGAVDYFGVAATETVVGLQERAVAYGGSLKLSSVPTAVANLLDLVQRAQDRRRVEAPERRRPQLGADEFNEIVAKAGLGGREGLCVTSGELDDPGPEILLVNRAFTEITGYRADDVLGLNPRFLQGPLSDRSTLDRLRSDLENRRRFEGETVNYRMDGSPFIMNWRIVPVSSSTGRSFFVGMQRDATEMRSLRRFERAVSFLNSQVDAVQADREQRRDALLDALGRAMVILVEDGSATVRLDAGDEPGASARVLCDATAGTITAPLSLLDRTRGVIVVEGIHPDRVRLADPSLVESLVDRAVVVINRS